MTGAMTQQRFYSTSARTAHERELLAGTLRTRDPFSLNTQTTFENCADEDEVPPPVGILRRALVQRAETTMTEQIKVHTKITFTKTGDDPHTFVPYIIAKKDQCIMATSVFPTHLKLGQTDTRFAADDAFSTDPDPANEDTLPAWNAPSGFILKLFQMINGPEDTITVSALVHRLCLIFFFWIKDRHGVEAVSFPCHCLMVSASRACVVATLLDDIGIGRVSYGLPLDPGRYPRQVQEFKGELTRWTDASWFAKRQPIKSLPRGFRSFCSIDSVVTRFG
jgi:hypothetical protein